MPHQRDLRVDTPKVPRCHDAVFLDASASKHEERSSAHLLPPWPAVAEGPHLIATAWSVFLRRPRITVAY
eukprot:206243-Prorocentrum_lima.AAC.1